MTNDTDQQSRSDPQQSAAVTTLTRVACSPATNHRPAAPAGGPCARSIWPAVETKALAELAGVCEPIGNDSPGARWLQATAARAERVSSLVDAGKTRANVVRLHAHHAVEDLGHDMLRVAADLRVRVRGTHIHKQETRFAAEAALFPVARTLLERLG
jgi:hypothetical protein